MEMKINQNPDTKELKQFGLLFGLFSVILFGLILPWVFNYQFPVWPWLVMLLFFIWSLTIPATLKQFYILWLKFGLIMNKLVTVLVLGLVYYFLITPMAVVFNLRGMDIINLKYSSDIETYRVISERRSKNSLERPF